MARLRRSKQDKALLDRLQQESWQLELILTGFVILGLFAGLETVNNWASRLSRANPAGGQSLLFLFPVFVYFAYIITLINLLIHVLIRGLWIGAVGLRSVSGDIDYYKLGVQPRFLNFLRKRTPSFDNYIFLLEEAASLMFAFTFLLIMMLGSAFLYFGFLAMTLGLVSNILPEGGWRQALLLVVLLPGLFFGVLYFLDFILLGRIKRSRFFARWYFPVYRFLGIVTLAFVYRPIYYNFIDNRIGRRALRLALPYLAVLSLVVSISYDGADYWVGRYERAAERSGLFQSYLYVDYYDDLREEPQDLDVISIPSPRIAGPVLPVFLEYLPKYDEVIRMQCPDLPADESFVIRSALFSEEPTPEEWGAMDERIACMQAPFSLLLDDQALELRDGLLTQKPDSRARGIQYFIPIDSLARGLHTLELRVYESRRRRNAPDTVRLSERVFIPFYRE
jgi:hypothetical protein